MTKRKQHEHSFTGDGKAGAYGIKKYECYLLFNEFSWINDCNGLKKFMDNDDHPLYEMQQA
jgi:hypothetical protein